MKFLIDNWMLIAVAFVSGAMLASVVAWTAFLVYAAAWVIGAVS